MTTPPEALRAMGADFVYAADALTATMQKLEQGRDARLKFLRDCITANTDRLAKLKEEVRTLPEQIAKWEAERARLESQTGLDLLRAVVAERQTSADKGPHCKGSWALGNNCRTCWRCLETKPQAAEQAPALLDLRGLKVGTVCEATGDIRIIDTPCEIPTGEPFTICTVLKDGVLPVEVRFGGQGDDWWLPALVPARVVRVPKGESDG